MAESTKLAAPSWDWVWRVAVWAAPVLFTAGGAWWQLSEVHTDLGRVEGAISALEERLRLHEAQPGHAEGQSRLEALEESQRELLQEQRRAGENLAAICQVTGARCR